LLAADPAQATTNAQLEKHQKDCKPWLVQLRYSQKFQYVTAKQPNTGSNQKAQQDHEDEANQKA